MNPRRPKISIVLSCYNYESYVGMAIESALRQTYPSVEIVVVDDGSTDGSADIIARYAERVISIRQENQGHVCALNRGYQASTGDVVAFLDADDLLAPTMTEEIARVWVPACAKVQGDLEVIGADGTPLGRRFCNFPRAYDASSVATEFERFGTYIWPVTSGNAYSRWFLESVMPLKVTSGPDGFLNTIAPVYGPILTVDIPIACYRLHGRNKSRRGVQIGDIAVRFRLDIARRRSELEALREHAALRSVPLPSADILDNEIVFINYRLMVLKCGEEYDGMGADSAFRLWSRGMSVLWERPSPKRVRLAHFLWLTALAMSPGWVATRLMTWRYSRDAYRQRLRKTRTAVMGKLRRIET